MLLTKALLRYQITLLIQPVNASWNKKSGEGLKVIIKANPEFTYIGPEVGSEIIGIFE